MTKGLKINPMYFSGKYTGVPLAELILSGIGEAEADGAVELTLNQAIAVAQVAATLGLVDAIIGAHSTGKPFPKRGRAPKEKPPKSSGSKEWNPNPVRKLMLD